MFDRLEPFLRGEADVGDFHIVLIVEPHLRPQRMIRAFGHHPDRQDRRLGRAFARWGVDSGGFGGIVQHLGGGQRTRCHTGSDHKPLAVCPPRRLIGIGAEHGAFLIPPELAPAVRPEVDDRRPTSGHSHGIAANFLQDGAVTGLQTDGHSRNLGISMHLGNGATRVNIDPERFDFFYHCTIDSLARVDDCRYPEARLDQHLGCAIGIIVVGHDDRALAHRDAMIDDIIAQGRGKDDTGHIVAREAERALDGPRCRDHTPDPYAPKPLTRTGLSGQMTG